MLVDGEVLATTLSSDGFSLNGFSNGFKKPSCREEHDLSDRYPERFADLWEKLISHVRAIHTEGGTFDVPERVK